MTSPALKWDRIYRERGGDERPPAAFLERIAEQLPERGKTIDIAGGSGRNALWLARHGLEVTCADISRVGLAHARSAAARAGLDLATLEIDLERQGIPAGPWDLIVCTRSSCSGGVSDRGGNVRVSCADLTRSPSSTGPSSPGPVSGSTAPIPPGGRRC